MNIKTRPLSQSELQKLLTFADPTWSNIFRIAYLTAFRVGDLIRLTWNNVTPTHIEILEEKTGKSKRVPIGPALKQALAYFDQPAIEDKFHNSYLGRPTHVLPFRDASTYRKALVRFCALAQIDLSRVSFHSIRKTAATAISDNIGIIAASQFLNHSKLSTTMSYIEVDAVEVSSFLEASSHLNGRMS